MPPDLANALENPSFGQHSFVDPDLLLLALVKVGFWGSLFLDAPLPLPFLFLSFFLSFFHIPPCGRDFEPELVLIFGYGFGKCAQQLALCKGIAEYVNGCQEMCMCMAALPVKMYSRVCGMLLWECA